MQEKMNLADKKDDSSSDEGSARSDYIENSNPSHTNLESGSKGSGESTGSPQGDKKVKNALPEDKEIHSSEED